MKKLGWLLLLLLFSVSGFGQKGKDAALQAIGGSVSLVLYNTYLVIGMAADGYAGNVYSAETAIELVEEQVGGIDAVKGQFEGLLDSGFLIDPNDVTYTKEVLGAFDLVDAEAEALLEYLNSGTDEAARVYEERRVVAWEEISRLLGID